MPDGLDIAYFVNSGTEANELALRLARNYSHRKMVYCVDGTVIVGFEPIF
jgi:4-aminobutyrate aminotransferase-like enzyme